jgi:hypothetical protein
MNRLDGGWECPQGLKSLGENSGAQRQKRKNKTSAAEAVVICGAYGTVETVP